MSDETRETLSAEEQAWRDKGPLRKWRLLTKQSQMQVAVALGVSLGIVNDWEAGRYWPKWENIVSLANEMRRDPANLEYALRKWWLQNPARVEEVTA